MKSEVYINKIIEQTGLSKKEIKALVEEKKEQLKGLISEDGALFVISKELGVEVPVESTTFNSFEQFAIKEVNRGGMKNLTLTGRITKIKQIHTFMKKDGTEGKVLNFTIKDNNDSIGIVVWDEATEVIKKELFKINALVQITDGYSKFNDYSNTVEINLGKFSKIIVNPTDAKQKDYKKIEVFEDDW